MSELSFLENKKIIIASPGTVTFYLTETPKLSPVDRNHYLRQNLKYYLPESPDSYELISFAHNTSNRASHSNCLMSITKKHLLSRVRSNRGRRTIIPSIIYLILRCNAGDGMYFVYTKNYITSAVIAAGALQEIQCQLQSTEQCKDSFNREIKPDGTHLPQFKWNFDEGINGLPNKTVHTPVTRKSRRLLTNLRNQSWFSSTSKKQNVRIHSLLLLLSLLIFTLAIVIPRYIALSQWQIHAEVIRTEIENLDIDVEENRFPAASDTTDLLLAIPVKFTALLNSSFEILEPGDFIDSIDFSNGNFTIAFVAVNPFSKKDGLESMPGISNLSLSRVTSISADSRERFSISGVYSYKQDGQIAD